MSTQVSNVNKINTGLCPHGLPPGACPICSNAAGSMRQSDKNRNVGEMTYHECAMIGNMMKARALAQKNHEKNLEHRVQNLQAFEKMTEKLSANMLEFAKQISSNIVFKPVAFVIQNVAVPVIKFIQNIPRFIQNIRNLKIEIQDKLNAIFGEAKAFIEKKISELVSLVKTKFEGLFKIFKKNNTEDEDTKIDDDKKIFNLKTILHKLLKKKDNKDERDTENK